MDGAKKSVEKQNKAMKKTSSRPGKWEANDLSQLKGLPGIRTIKGRKKKI